MAGNKDVHGRIQYAWQVTTRCMAGNKDVHGR
jgi:hypothetical protein